MKTRQLPVQPCERSVLEVKVARGRHEYCGLWRARDPHPQPKVKGGGGRGWSHGIAGLSRGMLDAALASMRCVWCGGGFTLARLSESPECEDRGEYVVASHDEQLRFGRRYDAHSLRRGKEAVGARRHTTFAPAALQHPTASLSLPPHGLHPRA